MMKWFGVGIGLLLFALLSLSGRTQFSYPNSHILERDGPLQILRVLEEPTALFFRDRMAETTLWCALGYFSIAKSLEFF